MRRFWVRFVGQVLPVWAREELLGRIRELEEENERLRNVVALKESYIEGLKWGVKKLRRGGFEEGKR